MSGIDKGQGYQVTDTDITFCGREIRSSDPDRFRISMFEPSGLRSHIWAILAFNQEIAKTREVVTETQIGHIRLQWWRERIAELYQKQYGPWQNNKILKDLYEAIHNFNLTKDHFDKLIYAREFDLEDVPPADMNGLINYADYTTAPLIKLITEIEEKEVDSEYIRNLSIGYALTGILRALPVFLSQSRVMLPEELLTASGIRIGHLVRGKQLGELSYIIKMIADEAGTRLQNRITGSVFVDLSQETAIFHLKKIQKARYNLINYSHIRKSSTLPIKLWLTYNKTKKIT